MNEKGLMDSRRNNIRTLQSAARGRSDLNNSSSEKPPLIYSVVGTVYFSSDKGKDTTLSEAL
jgi:hypothetical protein